MYGYVDPLSDWRVALVGSSSRCRVMTTFLFVFVEVFDIGSVEGSTNMDRWTPEQQEADRHHGDMIQAARNYTRRQIQATNMRLFIEGAPFPLEIHAGESDATSAWDASVTNLNNGVTIHIQNSNFMLPESLAIGVVERVREEWGWRAYTIRTIDVRNNEDDGVLKSMLEAEFAAT
jgi:hypothetical protein